MSVESVIINADDLGISEAVNDAIFELMARRRVTSATVLANGPAFRHAVSKIKHFPRCSFGAHLNLTQFAPVAPASDAALLRGADGLMSRSIENQRSTPKLLSAMYRELCAQVELLGSAGIDITHFDSHHHIHTKPQLFPVIKAVQRRFGVRKVRISKNIYTSQQPLSPALARKKRAYNWFLRNFFTTRTTDGFTELLSYRVVLNGKALSHRSVELMVHPGASYAAEEITILESDWLISPRFYAGLISYREL